MELRFFFAWYDFWIGFYYDQDDEVLYICPLPMCVIRINKDGYARAWFPQRCKTCGKWSMYYLCQDVNCDGSIPF